MSRPSTYTVRTPVGCNNCRHAYKTTVLPRGVITFCNRSADRPAFGTPEWLPWANASEVNPVYGTCDHHMFAPSETPRKVITTINPTSSVEVTITIVSSGQMGEPISTPAAPPNTEP